MAKGRTPKYLQHRRVVIKVRRSLYSCDGCQQSALTFLHEMENEPGSMLVCSKCGGYTILRDVG